jgi:hypothetical protein
MKKFVLLFVLTLSFLLFLLTNNSYSQNLLFAERAGSDSDGSFGDEGSSIAVDDEGNMYVTGTALAGSTGAIFGEGQPNETSLVFSGAFIAKYTNVGALVWVQHAGSFNNAAEGHAIGIDKYQNVYVSGMFYQEATFGLGQPNEITLSGKSGEIFIAKYDSDGQLIWAKSAGGDFDDGGGRGLAVDDDSNIYVTGSFWDEATFGAGESNQTVLAGQNLDIFLAKYDTNGKLTWVTTAGGYSHDGGKNVDLDKAGNIYITGNYFDDATFGKGLPNETKLNDENESAFIAKYNRNGNFMWTIAPFSSGTGDISGDIKIDYQGNIVFTGGFFGRITLGAGTPSYKQLTGIGLEEIIVAKYSPDGKFIWGKSASGKGDDRGLSIATDTLGNIFVSGYYGGDIRFGVGERNDTTLANSGGGDMFLAKFTPHGEFIWVTSASGDNWEQGSDVALDSAGNSHVTGFYGSRTVFGKNEPSETALSVNGTYDMYISKFKSSYNAIPAFAVEEKFKLLEDFEERNDVAVLPGKVPANEAHQKVTYSIKPETSAILNISFDEASGTLSLTSVENKFGEQKFVITADDGQKENYRFSQEFSITVEPVTDAPIITSHRKSLRTSKGDAVTIRLEDLVIENPDNTPPQAYSLTILEGSNYTVSEDKVMPDEDFVGELSVPVKINDGNLESEEFIVSIQVLEALGLEDGFICNNFSIYPNPFTNELHIDPNNNLRGAYTLRIYNTNGTLVYSGNPFRYNSKRLLNLSSLPKGMYFLQIISDSRIGIGKIIKN